MLPPELLFSANVSNPETNSSLSVKKVVTLEHVPLNALLDWRTWLVLLAPLGALYLVPHGHQAISIKSHDATFVSDVLDV